MGTTPAPAPNGSVSAVPSGEGLSQTSRIIDTFIAPSKTFTDINRSPSWWLPWVLMSISRGVSWSVDPKIGFQKSSRKQINRTPKQMERMERLPRISGHRSCSSKITQVYLVFLRDFHPASGRD